MFCDDLLFGLVAIYAIPASKTTGWYAYPFNVPYSPDVATISCSQLGKSSLSSLMADVKPYATLLTNIESDYNDGAGVEIYTEEKMSLQSTHKLSAPGISWTNTVKATAKQIDSTHASALAKLVTEPHDLVLVGDNGKVFWVRAVDTAYECSLTKKVSESGWTTDVQFKLINCHGAQEIVE